MIFTEAALAIGAFYAGRKAYKRRKTKRAMQRLLTDKKSDQPITITSPEQQTANRELAIATTTLGLAATGALVYSPLVLVSVVGLAYLTVPVWQRAYQAATKERRVKRELLDSVALPGLIVTGYVPAAAIGYWTYYVGQKLLADTKQRTLKKRDTLKINLTNLPTSELVPIETANLAVLPTVALAAVALPIAGSASAFILLDNPIIDGLYISGSLNALNHLALGQKQGLFIQDARVLEQIQQVDTLLFDEICLPNQNSAQVQMLFQQLQARGISIYIAGSGEEPLPTWPRVDYTSQPLPQFIEQLQTQGRRVSVVYDDIAELSTDTISIVWQHTSTTQADVILLNKNIVHLVNLFTLADQLARQSTRTIIVTATPSIVGIGSLFFLHTGVYGAVLLYQAGMIGGLGTAMWPWVKEKWNNYHTKITRISTNDLSPSSTINR